MTTAGTDHPCPAAWRRLPLAVLLIACAGAAHAEGVIVARVTRVIDGDSVRLEQHGRRTEVRLAAIDAPELRQRGGRDARAALQACAAGRIVIVQVTGTDRHGRHVGRLEAGGRDCGLAQLRAGMAWHYRAHADEQPAEIRLAYETAERNARQRRIGLWADPSPTPPWRWRKANPRPTNSAAR